MAESKSALAHSWTLWFDKGGARGMTQAEYESGITEIGTVSTVEDFWLYWNAMLESARAAGSDPKCNILVFKKGIRPTWEDPENANGGRWTLVVPRPVAEEVSTHVVLEAVGEQLPWSDTICGVVVRMRAPAFTVDVWNKNTDAGIVAATVEHISALVASVPEVEHKHLVIAPARYQPHKDGGRPRSAAPDSPRLTMVDLQSAKRCAPKSAVSPLSPTAHSPSMAPIASPTSDDHGHHRQQQAHAQSQAQAPAKPQVASPSPSRHAGEGVVRQLESLADSHAAPTAAAASTAATAEEQPQQSQGIKTPQHIRTGSWSRKNRQQLTVQVPSQTAGPAAQQQQQQQPWPQRSKDDTALATLVLPSSPKATPSQSGGAMPYWQCHKKSLSEDVSGRNAQAMRGRVAGLEQAMPVLLRQGFDVPASAYMELAQIKIHSSTPPDSPRALQCQQLLRNAGASCGPLPTAAYMQHRRAYSLDRTADELRMAYDSYSQAKREALLQPFDLSAPGNPQLQQRQYPLPGIGSSADQSPLAQLFQRHRKAVSSDNRGPYSEQYAGEHHSLRPVLGTSAGPLPDLPPLPRASASASQAQAQVVDPAIVSSSGPVPIPGTSQQRDWLKMAPKKKGPSAASGTGTPKHHGDSRSHNHNRDDAQHKPPEPSEGATAATATATAAATTTVSADQGHRRFIGSTPCIALSVVSVLGALTLIHVYGVLPLR